MISGHWEADRSLLSSAADPPMEYDDSGFPEHTYRILDGEAILGDQDYGAR
jgi:aromatic ring-opening dioxygenase catalytic subunit (LigB family)